MQGGADDVGCVHGPGSFAYCLSVLSILHSACPILPIICNAHLTRCRPHLCTYGIQGDYCIIEGHAELQMENLTSRVPWMLTNGNHEIDWPTGGDRYSSAGGIDSGTQAAALVPAGASLCAAVELSCLGLPEATHLGL